MIPQGLKHVFTVVKCLKKLQMFFWENMKSTTCVALFQFNPYRIPKVIWGCQFPLSIFHTRRNVNSAKRVVECRGGSRYVEGQGDSLRSEWKRFKVSQCLVFRVSRFQSFKVSKFQITLWTSKLIPNPSNVWDAHLQTLKFQIPNSKHNICLKWFWIFLIIWSVLVSQKMRNIGFESHGHVRQVQEP